ncbi:MAG: OmpH family outer membrane protein [Acidaminococcus sp.]|jgi:outer membrane protein|nr:OmpH family outer membrane protein [Acidaminococcus sp.]MCI2099881.1 OmpH family outer membrane protein [Acidaminococcus sp.]MCI2114112.1 OmpH family outer membrane protein [Acidaminococcus sp.]MCI2116052.1 OmpH family outer membrane protein [Acidaminococcus sp.]
MIEFAKKKNVKVVSLAIAAIFVIGAFAIAVRGAALTGSAGDANNSAIGKINYSAALAGAPGMDEARTKIQQAGEDGRKEYEEKSKDMSDADKQQLYTDIQKKILDTQEEAIAPLKKQVDEAIVSVSKTKGLIVVVSDKAVVYGGTDVTQDVLAAMKKQK